MCYIINIFAIQIKLIKTVNENEGGWMKRIKSDILRPIKS